PVKDMPLKRMIFRYRGMIGIVCRITAHPKPFHEGTRTLICRRCVRNDFCQRERPKSVVERQWGRLPRITLPPVRKGEAPADFHARRERGNRLTDNPANPMKEAARGTSI